MRATKSAEPVQSRTAATSSAPYPWAGAASKASLDDDADRVSAWLDMEPGVRKAAVCRHLSALDADGLELLRVHLGTIRSGLVHGLQEHRDNEAAFAAGRYFEDQSHYLRLRAMGAPPDAAWTKALKAIESAVRDVGQIQSQVEVARTEHGTRP